MHSRWWQQAVIYQVYPRSFQDTNRDGVGDLRGILQRLPHFSELGVDALWLSPIFPSPMADFGYDISDYTDIDPLFGTLDDFEKLVAAAHQRNMKIILDFVPNHTSDQHPWFQDSRSSRHSSKRDWYIWRDPDVDGGAPNNWQSEFGGPAWEYDPATRQFYCHTFLAAQPDLNWRNSKLRAAMYEVMRFWLGRGVDGFRVDVIWHLIKDEQFRNNPPNPEFNPGQPPHHALVPLYTADRPEVHDVIREMRAIIDEFADRVLIGEIYLPIERLVSYYGRDLEGLHLPFNFALLTADWHARNIARLIDEYEAALPIGGWPNWVLGNHDRPRILTRVGHAQAPIAAMLLLTLRGTPTIYCGDEIGMEQVFLTPEQVRDPFERNVPGRGLGRDGCRTPMQWEPTQNAGFSIVHPWLPVSPTYSSYNVETCRHDPSSIYTLYRKLIALRRSRRSLVDGTYHAVSATSDLLLFIRKHDKERLLVSLNLSGEPGQLTFPSRSMTGRLLLSSMGDREGEFLDGELHLRGNEGTIFELAPDSELAA